MRDRIPLLLDTDIGSDIDDAVALAYLLAEPRCELAGVTTVSGRARERAMLVDLVCRAAGRRDVPIFAGATEPLSGEQRQPRVPQAEILARHEHRDDFEPDAAAGFLRRAVRERPGELTLLTIGPLTNAALLCRDDPGAAAMLRGLVMMGGYYFAPGKTEWNVVCDPAAAEIVFAAPVPRIVAYGLDVTLQCRMSAAECRRRFRGGTLDVVAEMAEVWFKDRPYVTFHDPLAAACVFQADLCGYADGRVRVDRASEPPGATLFEAKEGGPHRVAREVDATRFFDRYFDVTAGAVPGD